MGIRTPTAAAKMYQVSSFLFLSCFALVTVLTGVDATCDGLAECHSNYNFSLEDTGLSVNSASELDSRCQTFESVRACVDPEVSTCDQDELKLQWLSYVSREQYLCSTEGRRILLANVNCFETYQNLGTAKACANTHSTAVNLVSQRFDSGYYESAGAANRDICRAFDDLYTCNCNAVRPACGQDAATFYHTYHVKGREASWNFIGCPTDYGSPRSCNGGNTSAVLAWKLLAAVLLLARI